MESVRPVISWCSVCRLISSFSDQRLNISCLEFADVLEQFESAFYVAALAKFQDADFTAAGFSAVAVPTEQFTIIQADEATHSTVLQVLIFLPIHAIMF